MFEQAFIICVLQDGLGTWSSWLCLEGQRRPPCRVRGRQAAGVGGQRGARVGGDVPGPGGPRPRRILLPRRPRRGPPPPSESPACPSHPPVRVTRRCPRHRSGLGPGPEAMSAAEARAGGCPGRCSRQYPSCYPSRCPSRDASLRSGLWAGPIRVHLDRSEISVASARAETSSLSELLSSRCLNI